MSIYHRVPYTIYSHFTPNCHKDNFQLQEFPTDLNRHAFFMHSSGSCMTQQYTKSLYQHVCITQYVHRSETKLYMQWGWFVTFMRITRDLYTLTCQNWTYSMVKCRTTVIWKGKKHQLWYLLLPCTHMHMQHYWNSVEALSLSCSSVFESAFVYLVGLKEFTYGRDETEHIHTYYWLLLEWSGTVRNMIGWEPCGSQPKSMTLLLGWSHSMLLPV